MMLLLGIALVIYAIVQLSKDDPPDPVHTFTAQLPLPGELSAVVSFKASVNAETNIQRVINRWAIALHEPKLPLHDELERHLRYQLPSFKTSVVDVMLVVREQQPEPPPKLTRAERVKQELVSDADTVQEIGDAINELRETRSELWDNRKYPGTDEPIGNHIQNKADYLIQNVLHGSRRHH